MMIIWQLQAKAAYSALSEYMYVLTGIFLSLPPTTTSEYTAVGTTCWCHHRSIQGVILVSAFSPTGCLPDPPPPLPVTKCGPGQHYGEGLGLWVVQLHRGIGMYMLLAYCIMPVHALSICMHSRVMCLVAAVCVCMYVCTYVYVAQKMAIWDLMVWNLPLV